MMMQNLDLDRLTVARSNGPLLSLRAAFHSGIRVAHLSDDPGLGGVTRTLDAQLPRLDASFQHARHLVAPTRGLPPALRADVIVIHFTVSWQKLPWLFGLRRRNPGAGIILVEHSYTRAFEALHVRSTSRFRRMLQIACALVDRVVTVSAAQGAWLAEAACLRPGKLVAINPFTPLDSLRALPLPSRTHAPLLVCGYGRYAPQKGFDTLIEAMRLVPEQIATLRLVGLGPDEAALRRQALDLPHVTVSGPVSGPEKLFAEVDAVVIPSRFEAFGNVGAEARAAGRPIVVADVDGLSAQALDAAELTVPPGDPAALAAAIAWLAGQDLAVLGAKARYSVEGTEARTIAAWNAILGETGARARRAG